MTDNQQVIQYIYDALRDLKDMPVAIKELQGQLKADGQRLAGIERHLATLNGTVAEQGRELAEQKQELHRQMELHAAETARREQWQGVLRDLLMPSLAQMVRAALYLALAWLVLRLAPQVLALVRP